MYISGSGDAFSLESSSHIVRDRKSRVKMARISRKRKSLERMSLKDLKKLQNLVGDIILKIERRAYPRDIDIAVKFHGEKSLVAELIHTTETDDRCRWNQTQKIYCCQEHCERCPHGPFTFSYWRLKDGQIRVKFKGQPVFDLRSVRAAFEWGHVATGFLVPIDERNKRASEDDQ